MAFECNFDFLSPEQNEKFAAVVNEMRAFSDNGSSEFVRVSRELRAVTKERDNFKVLLSGASKACEDLRREYKAFREVSASSVDKYERKIAVLEDRLRGYRDYAKRMARMAATSPEDFSAPDEFADKEGAQ